MNLTELRTFLAIVDTGSLVRASKTLNVTQSTVTARLKTLEQDVGQPLIYRQKSGATLTPAGVRLRRYARTITDLWRQAKQEVGLPDGLHTVCNIAIETGLWPVLGAGLFAHLRESQPNFAASVWQGSTSEVAAWMASGKADIALTYGLTQDGSRQQIEIGRDHLIHVATEPDCAPEFDARYAFVEAGDAFGRDHATTFADSDTSSLSFGDATLGLQHLLHYGGSAYLPRRIAAASFASGKLHHLPNTPIFTRPIFVAVNIIARDAWDWFAPTVSHLTQLADQNGEPAEI